MSDWQAVWLAFVQGFTEFLPISSSAHLILLPRLFGFPDQGLGFDIAVHVGTLAAVVFYLRNEIGPMLRDWFLTLLGRPGTPHSRLAWGVILATIPLGLGGIMLKALVSDELRSPLVIATTTIVFGLALLWADRRGRRERDEYQLGWRDVLLIGMAQVLALVPGTSRSGITITAGLLLGLTRPAAARFSFLLSIPAIVLPGSLLGYELAQSPEAIDWRHFGLGVALSALFAYLCIRLFMAWIARMDMTPFVIYRVVLGIVLLAIFL